MWIISLIFPSFFMGAFATIPFTPEIEEMGFRQLSPGAIQTSDFDPRDYMVYILTTSWEQGKLICQTYPGGPLQLVTFETEAEFHFVTEHVRDTTVFRGEFWTSGKRDFNSASGWSWDTNSMEISKENPFWAPNEPHPIANGDFRVTAKIPEFGNSSWLTKGKVEVFIPLICEKPVVLSEPVPCERRNDVIIVLDSSGSISPAAFQIALNFSAKLAGAIRRYTDSRIGFFIYSSHVLEIVPLNTSFSSENVEANIRAAVYLAGGTGTHLAFRSAITKFGQLDRPGVPKTLITVTDGYSDDPNLTTQEADRAIADGIRLVSVGVGNYNTAEILKLAGDNPAHVFSAENFNQLLNLLYLVSLRACA